MKKIDRRKKARLSRKRRAANRMKNLMLQQAIKENTKSVEKRYIPPERRRDILTYDYNYYNPATLRAGKKITPEQAKEEYNRLAIIVRERYKGLLREGYADTKIAKQAKRLLDKYEKGEGKKKEIIYGLSEMATFLMRKTSSAEGLRKRDEKILEKMNKDRADGKKLTITILQSLEEFFDYARSYISELEFSSKKVVEVFDYMVENKLDKDKFLEAYNNFKQSYPNEIKENEVNTSNKLKVTKYV